MILTLIFVSAGCTVHSEPDKKAAESSSANVVIHTTQAEDLSEKTENETIEKSTFAQETTQPTIAEIDTEQSEEFDISYWISYAQNYAQSIGLTLDETATECWDNPISANANNKNIGADIESRLSRYKNTEEFSSVWIWAEKLSDTQYELYIGYA
jgi:DNA primase